MIAIPLLTFLLSACNVTGTLQSNESLLIKNKIVIEGNIYDKRETKELLTTLPLQQPNRKMFNIFPVRLGLYTAMSKKKENKFRNWMMSKVGESPVIFKPVIARKSAIEIQNYIFNRGYLHNTVQESQSTKKKKVVVTYTVTPNERFHIDSIFMPDEINEFTTHLHKKKNQSLLKTGDPLDIDVLNEERIRLANILRNQGYFYFSKDYIAYEIDTNSLNKTANLHLKINEPIDGNGHQKYTVNNIYTYTNYSITDKNKTTNQDTILDEDYYFISEKLNYRTRILKTGIFFEKDKEFRLQDYYDTKRKFANFGTFRFVDVEFKDVSTQTGKNELDVHIHLSPAKKQSMSIQIEGNQNSNGLTGSGVSFTYKNKNLFKGADLLQFRVAAGLEFQFGNEDGSIVNNTDVSTELSYSLNRFLLPFPIKKASKTNNVKTKFTLGYLYQRRIALYSLHSTNFTFGYEWNESSKKTHIYNPIALTFLLIPKKTEDFEQLLDDIPSLRRSFEEQVIAGSNYSFRYANKKKETDKSYLYFDGNIRLAGNIIDLIASPLNKKKDIKRPYKLYKREYSQFARFEATVVHHWDYRRHAKIVSRLNTGIIIPYGNSEVSPYFHQFYAGGTNSIRAFNLRALGPGTYSDTTSTADNSNFFYDQSGDIKMEINTELRFDIYKFFKGALFLDAGNVWLLNEDVDREGGKFTFKEFDNGIALGSGIGTRLDFSYFVIRLDMAFPIRDPREPAGQRWVIKDFDFFSKQWRKENLIFNLAIGYPF